MLKKMREHTILFTEDCPLKCTYCYLRHAEDYRALNSFTEEEIFTRLAEIDVNDDPNEITTIIRITGGEPFLYWNIIEKILTKYQKRFHYVFNTCGYPLTEEKIKFLSNYLVSFRFSIDGGERLTNWLRPTMKKYKTGYFNKVKEIFPMLLYHFPKTEFKMIVGPRYVDLVHEQWLLSESLGFKHFLPEIDFDCRPEDCRTDIPWGEEHTEELRRQFDLILEEFFAGIEIGVIRPLISQVEDAITFIRDGGVYNVDNIPCRLFDGRVNYMLRSSSEGKPGTHCMSAYNPNLTEIRQEIIEAYDTRIQLCSAEERNRFDYIAHKCCPKNSLEHNGGFFNFSAIEEVISSLAYDSARKLLLIGTEEYSDNLTFKLFLKRYGFGGKEGDA